jgi:hypothetical protein
MPTPALDSFNVMMGGPFSELAPRGATLALAHAQS